MPDNALLPTFSIKVMIVNANNHFIKYIKRKELMVFGRKKIYIG